MVSRYLLSVLLAGLMTFVLFALMIGMIKIGQQPVASDVSVNMVDFIRAKRDRNLNLDETKPEPPPMPAAPPAPAQLQMEKFSVAAEQFDIGTDIDAPQGFSINPGLGIGEGGGDYLPIAQVAPQYPRTALSQGIEGWVLVEFTIGTEGQVKDPRIIKAEPPGVFDDSALSAVKRFRFKPRTVGNTAVEVRGVQNRIRFRLQR
ncbi:MAG: energy transducer TonB [Gammaproteobacteria bacterium]